VATEFFHRFAMMLTTSSYQYFQNEEASFRARVVFVSSSSSSSVIVYGAHLGNPPRETWLESDAFVRCHHRCCSRTAVMLWRRRSGTGPQEQLLLRRVLEERLRLVVVLGRIPLSRHCINSCFHCCLFGNIYIASLLAVVVVGKTDSISFATVFTN
jgi:hypothetical protein